MKRTLTVLMLGVAFVLAACATELAEVAADEGELQAIKAMTTSTVTHPEWSRDAVIYQINTRQYSDAGTFASVEADLDRIHALGVDILWLMPIHPIGEAKRKGNLGSPYAVHDFRKVNPELGTEADFRSLVDATHARGMKLIIDWVPNHSAWDNWMITEHPEWYTRDANGEMQHPPETDWFDVADLNYENTELRDYMRESLAYWVEEFDIDGFRCDVAGMVPTDFWNSVRPRLNSIKPVFMLAEWQQPELHEKAFDASYAWRWKEIMQGIVKDENSVADLATYYAEYKSDWPANAMRMTYTSNHDQNTWDGIPQNIYRDAYDLAMALSFIGEGTPLIYNGQECDNRKRLEFFEKDLIEWRCDDPINSLWHDLVQLKTDNPALHNGAWGARMTIVPNSNPGNIFSFLRAEGENTVLFVANLSDEPQSYKFEEGVPLGQYSMFRTNKSVQIEIEEMFLPAWGWSVYVRN